MFLRHRRPALDTMFAPESVALIGTTEAPGSVGRALVEKPEVIPRTHLSGESKARKDNFQIHNLVATRLFPTVKHNPHQAGSAERSLA